MAFEKEIQELDEQRKKAFAMGGPKKLAALKAEGRLNARERLDVLLDEGSFVEEGLLARSISDDPKVQERTPCDGKIAGFGTIDGRRVGVVSNDFTVMGASSSKTNGEKMAHIKNVCTKIGFPMVLLGESSGGRIPDNMGAYGMVFDSWGRKYIRDRKTPWANALVGMAFGSAAWYACMSDFNVMTKKAIMSVASARLCSLATGLNITPEELGGYRLHESTGMADMVVDTDEEALEAIKKFLSYLPSNNMQPTPRVAVPEGSDEACQHMLEIVPEERTRVYDMKKVIKAIVDTDSFFELKPKWGRGMITALARIDGRTVGIIANNPIWKGGAMDADGCEKATGFIVLCDSFNVPLIFMEDQPGFLIGIEGEKRKMPGRIINWMNAIGLATVPKITLQVRKAYGQGYLNMGGSQTSDEVCAWFTSETSFMGPEAAVGVVLGLKREDDPEKYDRTLADIKKGISCYEYARVFGCQDVIDPRESRTYLKRILDVYTPAGGIISQHKLSNWPTTY